ncbi:hypothetical protein [Acidovorax sp.]|uniref:hypothetical protein n=1 Tax=Acidovorax sp. TaxID=1872122 RepID=UPI00391F9D70
MVNIALEANAIASQEVTWCILQRAATQPLSQPNMAIHAMAHRTLCTLSTERGAGGRIEPLHHWVAKTKATRTACSGMQAVPIVKLIGFGEVCDGLVLPTPFGVA